MNNYQKSNVFSKNNCAVMYLGGEAKNESERNRLKITIELPTPCYFFYCRMKSFILFVSTNGVKKLYVKITADDKKIICENRELLG